MYKLKCYSNVNRRDFISATNVTHIPIQHNYNNTRVISRKAGIPCFRKYNKKFLYKPNKLALVPMCSIYEKINFCHMAGISPPCDFTCTISRKVGNPRNLKKVSRVFQYEPKEPTIRLQIWFFCKKLHPSLKKLGWIRARESVIQEVGIPHLAIDSDSQDAWGDYPPCDKK